MDTPIHDDLNDATAVYDQDADNGKALGGDDVKEDAEVGTNASPYATTKDNGFHVEYWKGENGPFIQNFDTEDEVKAFAETHGEHLVYPGQV